MTTKQLLLTCCIYLCTGQMLTAQTPSDDVSRQYDVYFLEAMVQRQKGNNDAAFDLLSRCIDINPKASEAYFFLGQYYAHLKQQEKALDMFRQAAELSPGNPTYMETLANAYIAQEKISEAIEVMERLYEKNKDRDDLLETLYQLYRYNKQYKEAIEVLDRLETVDGKSERLTVTKSQLYVDMDDMPAAIAEIKSLADRYSNDLNFLRLYGDMLRQNGQFDEAYDIYTRILKEEPDNSQAQLSMRTYYLMLSDSVAADSITQRILTNKHTGTDDKIYLLRREISQSEAEGGDSTRVLYLFQQMLALPQETADIAELCAAYMELKNMPTDSVAGMLEKVLEIAPDNARARLRLVSFAWQEENSDRIIELCKAARQYNPDEMAFYYYQGIAYYNKKDYDHALEAFQNGIGVINDESNPAIVSDFYAVMGDLLHQKGLEKEAYEAYDSCLQWKSDNLGCLNNYAYFLSEKGQQLDKAEQMSLRTVKAEPKNATYLDTYAWILFQQGRYAEARIYIDQAMQNDTVATSSVITEHGGDIYAMCGETDAAVRLWQQALTIEPGNKLVMRKIKKKKYIRK